MKIPVAPITTIATVASLDAAVRPVQALNLNKVGEALNQSPDSRTSCLNTQERKERPRSTLQIKTSSSSCVKKQRQSPEEMRRVNKTSAVLVKEAMGDEKQQHEQDRYQFPTSLMSFS